MNREFDRHDTIKNKCLVFGEIPGKLDVKEKPIDRYLNPVPLLFLFLLSQVSWKDKLTVSSDMQIVLSEAMCTWPPGDFDQGSAAFGS